MLTLGFQLFDDGTLFRRLFGGSKQQFQSVLNSWAVYSLFVREPITVQLRGDNSEKAKAPTFQLRPSYYWVVQTIQTSVQPDIGGSGERY